MRRLLPVLLALLCVPAWAQAPFTTAAQQGFSSWVTTSFHIGPERLAADPTCTAAMEGREWENTTTHVEMACLNGTATAIGSTGNSATATALAANGANCSSGQFPLGVDASGAAEGCSATLGAATATSVVISGTAGAGYVERPEQASAPATPTNAVRFYVDSSNRNCWIGENGFYRCFDGTANTANRIYTLPDAAGTMALTAGNPIGTGGMTGDACHLVTTNGCWYSSATGTAPSGTSEEVVATCTVKAGTLTTDSASMIRVAASFLHAANTNSSTGRIRWGGIGGTVVSTNTGATSNGRWAAAGVIQRLGSSSQTTTPLVAANANNLGGAASLNLANDQTLVVTLTNGTAASDAAALSLVVEACN